MENKLNLVEILKDCPKGMELYSPLCGDCKLYDVNDYNIKIEIPNKDSLIILRHDGTYCVNGEIMIFPKGKTTWEGFVPPCNLKEESEDERIREALIALLKFGLKAGSAIAPGFNETREQALVWLETQGNKDRLIKELGEYKVKYIQEVIEKHINSMSNKDDERLRKTAISFLKDFADKGYENAVECIAWLEKQGEQNPYSGVSFKYNGHTFGMCARDGGAEILMDGNLKAFISLDKSFVYPINSTPLLESKNFQISTVDGLIHDITDNPTDKIEN